MPVKNYVYKDNIREIAYQPDQILHFKYPDPNDPIEGIGTVQSVAQWIDADNYATEFNRRFFLNGARLGGLLESEQSLTPAQIDYLRRSFEDIYKGVENAYKVAALPKGTKYTETGTTPKELDFVEGQKLMRDKILAGFRVPKTVLGTAEQETNRATAETANYVFAQRTVRPKLRLIVSYLNEFLVPRFGENIYLDFENVVPEDRELKLKELTAAMSGQPVISANEARESYFGLGPVKNGEDVMTDFSHTPLGSPEEKPASKAGRGRMKQKAASAISRFARNAKKRKEVAESVAKKAADELRAAMEKMKDAPLSQMTDDQYAGIWKAFVSRVTPYEKALDAAVKKFNAELTNEVLQNLASAIKRVDADALFELDRSSTALAEVTRPILTDLYAKEGKQAAKLIGRDDIEVMTPAARAALDRAVGLMADSYTRTTRDLLKEKLEAGIEQGMSLDELAQTVQDIRAFSDEYRAQQVARTETFRTANEATRTVWEDSGVVKKVKWYTAEDERVCEYCSPMNGETVGIDETFFDKGDTAAGNDGGEMPLEYDDVNSPPLHPSCRCYIRPADIEA